MYLWLLFTVIVLVSLYLDVSTTQTLTIRRALYLSLAWVMLALSFNMTLYYIYGSSVALEFLASYLLEKGLSVDNVFVFYLIFEGFEIPDRYQRSILQWGIIGALFMRGIFIATGIQLLHRFHFLIFIFGGFLVYTGGKLMMEGDEEEKEEFHDKWFISFIQRYIPYIDDFGNGNFFVKVQVSLGKPVWHATRLFFALVTVEIMDAVFALDSIPAILSLTDDPLVVYTSNIFAILGLRALYFAISGMVHKFQFLKYGLSIILIFVGIKMLISAYIKIPLVLALLFIASVIIISIVISLYITKDSPMHKSKVEYHNVNNANVSSANGINGAQYSSQSYSMSTSSSSSGDISVSSIIKPAILHPNTGTNTIANNINTAPTLPHGHSHSHGQVIAHPFYHNSSNSVNSNSISNTLPMYGGTILRTNTNSNTTSTNANTNSLFSGGKRDGVIDV